MQNCGTNVRVTRSKRNENSEFYSLQPIKRRARVANSVNADLLISKIPIAMSAMSRTPTKSKEGDLLGGLDGLYDETCRDKEEQSADKERKNRDAKMQQEIQKEWARLKKLREEIDSKMVNLEAEKLQIAREKEQVANERRQVEENRAGEQNGDIFGGLMRHFQSINLDVKVPRFNEEVNPIQFLNELERFLKSKNIRVDQYLMALENILEGSIWIWFEVARSGIRDFEDFKKQFKNEFYSVPIQIRFRNEWSSRRYSPKDESMTAYFYKQVRSAQFLEPKLPEHQVHLSVIQQFPFYIQNALAAVDFSNIGLVAQALSLLEGTKDRPREVNTFGNQQQHRYPRVNKVAVTSDSHSVNRNQGHRNMPYCHHPCREYNCCDGNHSRGQDCRRADFTYNGIVLPDTRIPPPNYNNRNVSQTHSNEHNLNSRSAR